MIGLVSIAAISLGAATIESTVELGAVEGTDGDQIPLGGGGDQGSLNMTGVEGNGSVDLEGSGGGGVVAEIQGCVEPLAAWYGTIAYFGAFAGVVYLIKRTYSFGAAILGTYAILPVMFTVYFLKTDCASTVADQESSSGVVGAITEAAGQGAISPEVSPVLIAAVFGLALVAVAAVLFRASGDQTVTAFDEDEEAETEQADVADLAAAAGEAADRLEKHDADVDNEVYRAWWEMTSLLNVPDPETSTPGEFAGAAVEAGMDEAEVGQLTTLFEEVRYGRRDPEAREERAIEIFREIESKYGDAGSEGDDGR